MKTLLTLIFTGILFFISVTTTAALDVVNNELLDQKHEQVLKMKLADDDLTIFLVDTSGNMQNTDKQMTIDLITRFAQESGQAKIAVMSYGNDSQILVEPTTDRDLIREKLANLSTGGESNLTAGLKAAETLAKQQSILKANLFIIADNAPTTGDTLKKGIYNSKDSHSYKYANAAHEYVDYANVMSPMYLRPSFCLSPDTKIAKEKIKGQELYVLKEFQAQNYPRADLMAEDIGLTGHDLERYYEKYLYYGMEVDIKNPQYGGVLSDSLTAPQGGSVQMRAKTFSDGQFDGWYMRDKLISREQTLTYQLMQNEKVVAKFSASNGAENEN